MEFYMNNFLNSVLKNALLNYCDKGATSSRKVYPLHSYGNNEILANLTEEYEGHGYGLGDDKEHTIDTGLGNWKADGYFSKAKNRYRLVYPQGMAIDYKCPMSNISQNKNNLLTTIKGISSTIRPFGYGFGTFIMLPDESLWFKNDGSIKCREIKVTETLLKEITELSSLSPKKYQCVPDLIGICSYKLPLDYSTIKTKDDFIEAIKSCDTEKIDYVFYDTITPNERFIYNDPDAFFKKFSEMAMKKKPFYII